ncbi:MAG TPA: glycogen/starch synthase, partial [Planctomycetota bacterium]|nr:glycogen/starch synthase [Planctomycetota bacterium]
VGPEQIPFTLYQSASGKNGHQVYFIGADQYFDRDGLYGTAKGDYEDSASRFIFFSRACLMAAQILKKPVDIWHCHDWQSALIPIYLKLQMRSLEFFKKSATVFTIHNIAYQGLFWHWDYPLLNLAWQHYNWKELEFHGKMNLLKGALVHSDLLATVSPTYAREIQTAEYGFGLDGVLRDRQSDLVGIVNGIDTAAWNPRTDLLLPATYHADDLSGKKTCRSVLRKKMNLPDDGSAVIGMIGRLFEQKGFDLVAQGMEELLKRNVQIVILGTGREEYHRLLQRVQEINPNRIAVAFAFDNALAHLIEAGSDMFLMPSRYEPCGLNQLYSLAYGTPPIVHNVGGLADTVTDTNPNTIGEGKATGFKFDQYSAPAMLSAIDRALHIFSKEPELWRRIQTAGMRQDWSWSNSARQYVEAYTRAAQKRA